MENILQAQVAALRSRNAELKKLNEHLAKLAYTDALTGCQNRHSYNRRMRTIIGVESWVYIDLCKLGIINNTLGHEVADEVLAKIGHHLRGQTDSVYRTGGDEFVIILDCPIGQAAQVMQRVEGELQGYSVGGIPVLLAWGVGENMKAAEKAMYAHKAECHQQLVGCAPLLKVAQV